MKSKPFLRPYFFVYLITMCVFPTVFGLLGVLVNHVSFMKGASLGLQLNAIFGLVLVIVLISKRR